MTTRTGVASEAGSVVRSLVWLGGFVRGWVALVGLLGATFVGCPCTDSVINSSPWLRWYIFANYGANQVCQEMIKRGALVQAEPPMPGLPRSTGRFFPQTCQSSLNNETRTLSLWITGNGYAWTPATQKLGFDCAISIEYKPDFHKDGDRLYAWFDVARPPPPPQFKIRFVEQMPTNLAFKLPPVEWFATQLAASFVTTQLARGFTVIRDSGGDDYSLGRLAVGQRPKHPFDVSGHDRFTFVNEVSEIHGQQQDFLGPFEVDREDRALFVKMQVAGPPVDLFMMTREAGYQWRMKYSVTSPPPPPPPGQPILRQAQTPPNGLFEGWVALPRGLYYLVVDHSAYAGGVRPPPKLPTPLDPSLSQPTTISYAVQVGDKPD